MMRVMAKMSAGRLGAMVLAVVLITGPVTPAMAQDREQTLADIRQELSVLYVEIQRLKQELVTTSGATVPSGGGTSLDRIIAIEGEVTKLIGKTEELEYRIDQIVSDGTNRIGDLEFRLVQLEGGDLSKLGETTTLGGGDLPSVPMTPIEPVTSPDAGGELAVGEKADFDTAMASLNGGSFEDAQTRFGSFVDAYPGSLLTAQAYYYRGEALSGLGRTKEAGQAYLAGFSADPNGDMAPEALYRLGTALGQLGQVNEACVTLSEVAARFPASPAVADATAEMQGLGCQ